MGGKNSATGYEADPPANDANTGDASTPSADDDDAAPPAKKGSTAPKDSPKNKPKEHGYGAYPQRRKPSAAAPVPKTPPSQAAANKAYPARQRADIKARLASPNAAVRAQAQEDWKAMTAERNAFANAVGPYKTAAAAAASKWLDRRTEMPVYDALRRCTMEYNRARRETKRAAAAGRGKDAASDEWAVWEAQLVRGRRCNRWRYDLGVEVMQRATALGDAKPPLTERWAWLLDN
jgi:hypothetical protein